MSGNTDTAVQTNGHNDTRASDIDLPLAVNHHWTALDLNEFLERAVNAGLPDELIVTWEDSTGRRHYARVHAPRDGRKGVAA